jgi:hypothetical protein
MSKTQALAVQMTPSKIGSARKPSEIARLMEKVEEFCQIRRLVDQTIIEADGKQQPLNKWGRELSLFFKDMETEAFTREYSLFEAMAALEPETPDDALAVLIIANNFLDNWMANHIPDELKEERAAGAIDWRVASQEMKRIKRMIEAVVRALKGNGAAVPEQFSEQYDTCNRTWTMEAAELRAQAAHRPKGY